MTAMVEGSSSGGAHPVRLVVADDLQRNRLTVLFRILLVIPHLIWLALWGIASFFVAIVNWLYALVAGRPADPLHRFLARFITYSVHVNAYLFLVAAPYPEFNGDPGVYDVDVVLPPPAPQPRWKIFFRLVLALPALVLGSVLGGVTPWFGYARGRNGSQWSGFVRGGILLGVCGFLGWFASLVRGQMPKGLRDAGAFSLGYSAQTLAYLLLIAERYPDADPATMLAGVERPPSHPVRIEVTDDLRRSRLTVFFRLILAIPHLVWLTLWSIAMIFVAIANWFATLVGGEPAAPLHRLSSAYVRYQLHVTAFLYVVASPFPGFAGAHGSYPVDVELPPPARQHRAVTGFRIFLAVPALLVSAALSDVIFVSGIFMWFTGVVLGRVPRGVRNVSVYALRYAAQLNAYLLFVTERYPHASPLDGAERPVQDAEAWTPPALETAPPETA
jgi:hypothetical protein